jgi:NADH-quinone oxidoreductase subunit M
MPGTGNALGFPLLTIILFLPAAAGLICLAIEDVRAVKVAAVIAVAVDFVLSMFVLAKFELSVHGGVTPWSFQFADHHSWVSSLGISYWVGVDGISVFLVGLTTLMMGIAVIASLFMISENFRGYIALMLLLETGLLGVFMSINVFLFFVFWEAMLIPMYFLLGVWGEERRVYATMKFLIYTIFGSFLMLVAVFYLWAQTGTLDMAGPHGLIAHPVSSSAQTWLFLAFGLAFAIKLPLFPFHTWAPTAYSESPIPVVVALAGVMSKAGAFGFLRYCLPLFPLAAHRFEGLISILAIVGLLYAAGLALVQTDIKRIVAYGSISHMNLIALGIFSLNATGFDGSVLQMINHSVIISGLFLVVGYITARTGSRILQSLGGLGSQWPFMMWMFFVLVLAGLDLPGLGSFAGEFLILAGVFRENAWFSSVAAVIVILAAWYMIRFFQDTMNGPLKEPAENAADTVEDTDRTPYQFPPGRRLLGDIRPGEGMLLVPLIFLIVYIGLQPDGLTARMNQTTDPLSALVQHAPTISGPGGGR